MKKLKQLLRWDDSRVFDLAIEGLILVVILLMPTIFDRRLGIVFSGTKTAWMRAFGAVILGIWAIKLIVTKQHRFFRTPLDWPVLSFLLCTTVATLSSVHVYTSIVGFYGRYEGLTSWYLFGLFFFVVTNYIRSFNQLKRAAMMVIPAATLMAVYSVLQRHALDPYMWGGVVTWQRVIGTIGQPNFLAAYMLMAFFINLALIMMRKEARPKAAWHDGVFPLGCFAFSQLTFIAMIYNLEAYNILLWYLGFTIYTVTSLLFVYTYEQLPPRALNLLLGFTLLINYISILYTQSRGGYLGLFTGLVLFLGLAGRDWIFINRRKLLAVGALILLISGVTMSRPEYSPFARFASEIKTEQVDEEQKVEEQPAEGAAEEKESKLVLEGAAGSRGETWKSAFCIVADYPVFGIGPEVLKMVFPRYETDLFRFKETFHVKQDRCHNETFDVPVTKGLLAFFVFVWLLFTLFKVGWRKNSSLTGNERSLLVGLLGAALAFIIQNQFSFGVVAITSLFWMIWAMVMVVGEREESQKTVNVKWSDLPWFQVAAVLALVCLMIYVSFFSFRGDVWFKSGKTQMQVRRFDQAVADLNRSLDVFPFEGGTVSHLGICYLNLSNMKPEERMKNVGEALRIFTYGTEIDPYNADNFYLLSKILFSMNDLARAKEKADIAIKIDPYYAEVYHLRGLLYERLGQNDLAASDYQKAFMINPGLSEPMHNLILLNRRLNKESASLAVFDQALKRYGDHPSILETATKLYLQAGRIDQAKATAARMLKVSPKYLPGYVLRAAVAMQEGRLEDAYADLQQVLMDDPKNVSARLELGRLYLMKGQRARARQEFEQVLRLDPNNVFARQLLQR
ncbi:MAG: tetratricopeptide repeat protein [Candidatus Saganbacteria bacterium]|nr:tetratricopeptide repeat protein [Candidatus Saganbacteria bacterium]